MVVRGTVVEYIATAGPHHGESYGSLVMLDLSIPNDDVMSQVRGSTPVALFPESETGSNGLDVAPFATPWPLSEDFALCGHKNSIVLQDRFGNRGG